MQTSRLLLEIWRGTVTSTFFIPALRHWERELPRRSTTDSSWRLYILDSLDCMSRLANVLCPSSSVRNSSRFGEMISKFVECRSTTTQWKSFFRADIPILNRKGVREENRIIVSQGVDSYAPHRRQYSFLESPLFKCSEAAAHVRPFGVAKRQLVRTLGLRVADRPKFATFARCKCTPESRHSSIRDIPLRGRDAAVSPAWPALGIHDRSAQTHNQVGVVAYRPCGSPSPS
jgi:hypothetical protein